MKITLTRAQVESILTEWANKNYPMAPPLVDSGKWKLGTLSSRQTVLEFDSQKELFVTNVKAAGKAEKVKPIDEETGEPIEDAEAWTGPGMAK